METLKFIEWEILFLCSMETWNLLWWEILFLCSMETVKFYTDKFYYDYVVWKFYAEFYYVVTIIGE